MSHYTVGYHDNYNGLHEICEYADDAYHAIKQAEDSVQNMLESIDMMESIIRLAAISDKYSLELQKWIKEYKLDVELLDAQITEVATHD